MPLEPDLTEKAPEPQKELSDSPRAPALGKGPHLNYITVELNDWSPALHCVVFSSVLISLSDESND